MIYAFSYCIATENTNRLSYTPTHQKSPAAVQSVAGDFYGFRSQQKIPQDNAHHEQVQRIDRIENVFRKLQIPFTGIVDQAAQGKRLQRIGNAGQNAKSNLCKEALPEAIENRRQYNGL